MVKPVPIDPTRPEFASVTPDKPLDLGYEAAIALHGGNGDDGMNTTQKDYVDAKLGEVRAQNDARFAEILSRLERMPSTWTVIAAGVSVFLGIVGVLAFGGDRFDGGVQVTTAAVERAIEAQRLAKENAEQIRTLIQIIGDRVQE